MKSFAVYGFGRAGRSLCASLRAHADGQVIAFCRKPSESQREFAKRHGVQLFDREDECLACAEQDSVQALFIAVSDDAISAVAARLRSAAWLPQIVAHLSGVLSCEDTAQFHPLASLDGETSIPEQCLVAVNCDHASPRKALLELAARLGCIPVVLKTGDQALYHAAASLTGNLSLGLVSMSQKLFQLCGIEKSVARLALAKLLKSAAHALETNDLKDALTGPLARGDVQTIAKHVDSLSQPHIPTEILAVYSLLSTELLDEKNSR